MSFINFVTKKIMKTIVLLHLTNPFINHFILDKALDYFFKNKYSCLLSAVLSKKFLWQKSKFANQLIIIIKRESFLKILKIIMLKMVHSIFSKKKTFKI